MLLAIAENKMDRKDKLFVLNEVWLCFFLFKLFFMSGNKVTFLKVFDFTIFGFSFSDVWNEKLQQMHLFWGKEEAGPVHVVCSLIFMWTGYVACFITVHWEINYLCIRHDNVWLSPLHCINFFLSKASFHICDHLVI